MNTRVPNSFLLFLLEFVLWIHQILMAFSTWLLTHLLLSIVLTIQHFRGSNNEKMSGIEILLMYFILYLNQEGFEKWLEENFQKK